MGVIYLTQVPGDRFALIDQTAADPGGAVAFYQQVAGMTISPGPSPLPVTGEQQAARPDGQVSEEPDGQAGSPEPIWIAYIGVDDVDVAVARASELGGQVLMPPTDLTGFGRAAVLRDSQGIAFGIFTRAR